MAPLVSTRSGTPAVHAQTQQVTCSNPSQGIAPDDATPLADDGQERSGREALAAQFELMIRTYAACLSDGNYEAMSRLVTESYLGATYGGGPRMSRETFVALSGSLPVVPVRFRDLDDLSVVSEGEARANIKLIYGNQFTFERFVFVEEERRPGTWLIDSATPLRVQPPRDHAEIEVRLAGDQFVPNILTASGANVEIRIENADIEDHEFLLLNLADGVTANALLNPGSTFPAGIQVMAQLTVPGGTTGRLVLVGMKPGTYTFVDMLPNSNGVPHLSLGMQGTLTITE
jgi:hypothetical protein